MIVDCEKSAIQGIKYGFGGCGGCLQHTVVQTSEHTSSTGDLAVVGKFEGPVGAESRVTGSFGGTEGGQQNHVVAGGGCVVVFEDIGVGDRNRVVDVAVIQSRLDAQLHECQFPGGRIQGKVYFHFICKDEVVVGARYAVHTRNGILNADLRSQDETSLQPALVGARTVAAGKLLLLGLYLDCGVCAVDLIY